jgi:hypothetical protein
MPTPGSDVSIYGEDDDESTDTPEGDPDQYLWSNAGRCGSPDVDELGAAPGFDQVVGQARGLPAAAGSGAAARAVRQAVAAHAGEVSRRPLPASMAQRGVALAVLISKTGHVRILNGNGNGVTR